MSKDCDAVANQSVSQPLYLEAQGEHSPLASHCVRAVSIQKLTNHPLNKQPPSQPHLNSTTPSPPTYLPTPLPSPFPFSPLLHSLHFPLPKPPLSGHTNPHPPMSPLLPPGPLPLMPFPPTPRAKELVIATGAADGGVGEADGAPGCCWVFVGGSTFGSGFVRGRVGGWDGGEEGGWGNDRGRGSGCLGWFS